MAFQMKRHDTRPVYKAQLRQTDPNDASATIPVDLTTATAVKFIMSNNNTIKVNAAATVTDAANGRVQYTWIAADTDTSGVFNVEWQVSWGTDKQTFPSAGYSSITISDDLDNS
jgi:NADPH-dependent ferric siderophore reductase